jgi:hypothetical protein
LGQHARNKLIPVLGIVLLFLSFVPSITPKTIASTNSQGPTGIMVPLYGYPGPDWNVLASTKAHYPSVPMVAVVNPDNGPGTWEDPNFLSGVITLHNAGVFVIGYVWTGYASRNIYSVEADILAYKNLYNLDGVYLDAMSNLAGEEWYYAALTSYAHSIGMWLVVGNPGASVPSSYGGTVDSMIVYENSGVPSTSWVSQITSFGPKSEFGAVAYGVGWVDSNWLGAVVGSLGYIYLTGGVLPNPYIPISVYLATLASDLSGYDLGQGSGSITITTIDSSGNELWGLYTTLWENGDLAASCYSPCTFSVSGGQTYQVEVANYGPFSFAEWGNGLLSHTFTVSEPSIPTQLGLWAIYHS